MVLNAADFVREIFDSSAHALLAGTEAIAGEHGDAVGRMQRNSDIQLHLRALGRMARQALKQKNDLTAAMEGFKAELAENDKLDEFIATSPYLDTYVNTTAFANDGAKFFEVMRQLAVLKAS